MKFFSTLMAVAGFASIVTAASNPDDFETDSVDKGTRKQWCTAQKASCPLICTQLKGGNDKPKENDCDPDDLSFSCICNNDQTPNATEYSQTIPYFICTQQNNDCVNACPNNNADCQYNCRAQNPCGAKSPKRYNITTTTTATTASATGDVTGTSATPSQTVYSGMAGEEDSSPSNGAIGLTPVYGYGVLLSAFIGGFAVFL